MTKSIGFVWLKPEATGEFCAHGDTYSVSTEVEEILVQKRELLISHVVFAFKNYVSVNFKQKAGQYLNILIVTLL
jgi:hypothetical protein